MAKGETKTIARQSNDDVKRLSMDCESWLKAEFEQNFLQLRNRDDKIIGLTKFYVTAILSVGSAAIALMGLSNLKHPHIWLGFLLFGTCIVGEILFVWMIAFRKYFVNCARQLNAIRRLYYEFIPVSERYCIVQPIDPSFPPLLNRGSAHIIVMLLMSFLNAIVAALSAYGLTLKMTALTDWQRILICFIGLFVIILVNEVYMRKSLREGDRNV